MAASREWWLSMWKMGYSQRDDEMQNEVAAEEFAGAAPNHSTVAVQVDVTNSPAGEEDAANGSRWVVGQWVEFDGRFAKINQVGDNAVELDLGTETCCVWNSDIKPFVWQIGNQYKTTSEGVTARISRVNGKGDMCGSVRLAVEFEYWWHAKTGKDFSKNRHIDLLPFLAEGNASSDTQSNPAEKEASGESPPVPANNPSQPPAPSSRCQDKYPPLPQSTESNEVLITKVAIVPRGEAIFHEMAMSVEIEDEAAGEFVKISQTSPDAENGVVAIDPGEWKLLREVVDAMVARCRV